MLQYAERASALKLKPWLYSHQICVCLWEDILLQLNKGHYENAVGHWFSSSVNRPGSCLSLNTVGRDEEEGRQSDCNLTRLHKHLIDVPAVVLLLKWTPVTVSPCLSMSCVRRVDYEVHILPDIKRAWTFLTVLQTCVRHVKSRSRIDDIFRFVQPSWNQTLQMDESLVFSEIFITDQPVLETTT